MLVLFFATGSHSEHVIIQLKLLRIPRTRRVRGNHDNAVLLDRSQCALKSEYQWSTYGGDGEPGGELPPRLAVDRGPRRNNKSNLRYTFAPGVVQIVVRCVCVCERSP